MPEFRDVYTALRQKTGRTLERGLDRTKDDYFLGVCIWLRRDDGCFLISRRAAAKSAFPLFWEPTGGGVLAGETTLHAALREVREELGIELNEKDGMLFGTVLRKMPVFPSNSFEDIYVFRGSWPLSSLTFQKEETCDARWATQEEIRAMIADGQFVPERYYPYLDALFAHRFE